MVAKAQPSVNSESNVSEEGVRADTRPNMDFANVEYYIQFLGVHVDSIPQISDYKKQMRIEDDEGAGVTRKFPIFSSAEFGNSAGRWNFQEELHVIIKREKFLISLNL